MPEFNWGFNAHQDENDDYGADAIREPDAEPDVTGYAATAPEDTAEQTEPSDDGIQPTTEQTVDDGDAAKGRTKPNPPRKTREKTAPHIEERFAKKLIPLAKSLDDERVVSLAKALTDTKRSSPEAVLDALTEPRNQRRIGEFATTLDGLRAAEPDMVASEVTLVLAQGKETTGLLFAVLNAIAPERNFGRPADDQSPTGMRRNRDRIVSNWGDGIDLSLIDLLRI